MTTSPRDQAYQFYLALGYEPHQAAAIVGSLQQESNFNTRAVGDQGTAFGMGQWRHDRFDNLKRYAASQGRPWHDFEAQLGFLDWEMRNTESKAGDKLRSSGNIGEALNAAYDFWRPAASREVETSKRYRYAAPLLGGDEYAPKPVMPGSRSPVHPDVAHGLSTPGDSPSEFIPLPRFKPEQGIDWKSVMGGAGGLLQSLAGGSEQDQKKQAFWLQSADELDQAAQRRRAWNQSFDWL